MRCWIAYEHDDSGHPTTAFVLAIAATSEDAKQTMIRAIDTRAATAAVQDRQRLYAIFVEAPQELPADDPRQDLITDPVNLVFSGFD